jgi:hypothetical protein
MACLVNKNQRKHKEFKSFIINQDLIGDIDLYKNYSNDKLYDDICNLLKNDKYLKEELIFNIDIDERSKTMEQPIIKDTLLNGHIEENEEREYKCVYISDDDDNENDVSSHTITTTTSNEKSGSKKGNDFIESKHKKTKKRRR